MSSSTTTRRVFLTPPVGGGGEENIVETEKHLRFVSRLTLETVTLGVDTGIREALSQVPRLFLFVHLGPHVLEGGVG